MIRVLVADDHPIVRSGVVATLAAAPDIDVVGEAADGSDAVALAEASAPDVVLMDLRMPVLGGVAATEQLLSSPRPPRVLVLTTYDTDDDIIAAIEAGASGYLLKAAPADEILAAVRAVAAGKTALAPSIAAALVARVRSGAGGAGAGPRLSARELEVLKLVASGHSNGQIAAALFISEATVKTHLIHVFEKLEVTGRTRAVTRAQELGML
ncbi:response regulator transcription factor [Gryllotalpicola daejeonensis]|uniref:Response regulator transcription factor n=1 Tax=Gryllotalpicola daejeonensis TaxID=993087 RepID=A0ABP7ZKF1_9MICO